MVLSVRIGILRVVDSFDERSVVSSMNAFTGGIWITPVNSTISALFFAVLEAAALLEQKVLVKLNNPWHFQLQACSNCKLFNFEQQEETIK